MSIFSCFNYRTKINELFESTKLFNTFFSEQRVRLELTVVDYKSTGLPINRPMQLKIKTFLQFSILLDTTLYFGIRIRAICFYFCWLNKTWTCNFHRIRMALYQLSYKSILEYLNHFWETSSISFLIVAAVVIETTIIKVMSLSSLPRLVAAICLW